MPGILHPICWFSTPPGPPVQNLGQRLDVSVFSVPAERLSAEGKEVFMWRYCANGPLTEDLGRLGIGALAQNPAPVQLAPDTNLYVIARNVLQHEGQRLVFSRCLSRSSGQNWPP